MDSELSEVIAFVSSIPPFDNLDSHDIASLVNTIEITYHRKGSALPTCISGEECLYIVRKGALTYVKQPNELLGKYGEGDICTIFCYPDKYADIIVTCEEDCLLYQIPKDKLLKTIGIYPKILAFFEQSAEERLQSKVIEMQGDAIVNSSLSNTQIEQLYNSPAATIEISNTIHETATKMTEFNYSCLVVVNEKKHPVGIVTDKDFRRRCIVNNIEPSEKISRIMTDNISTMDLNNTAFDALIYMTSRHIHHLPITKNNELAGMLTITDLMHFEGQNAINLTSLIHKAKTTDDLISISKLIPKLQIKMASLGTAAEHVGKSITAITMALTLKLIEFAENKLGKPPVPYAWLSAGSQARQEQYSHSDQDNALIISNDMKPEDDEWFKNLATFVSDGLNRCGFIYCPGNVMATNDKWRQTEEQWQRYFNQWISTPDPKALMHSSIFFDLTTVYGETKLLDRVRKKMLNSTSKSTLFIAHLSKNALQHKPPLGFFRDFVLINNGKHKKTMDLKHNGIAPIVDLARIYALSEGISAVSTIERLSLAAGSKSLTKTSSLNLIDAFQFLSSLKLRHQARQLQAGEEVDNYLAPKEISRLEREHLKDAFKVIKTLQDSRQTVY